MSGLSLPFKGRVRVGMGAGAGADGGVSEHSIPTPALPLKAPVKGREPYFTISASLFTLDSSLFTLHS
jgi:hypothetical protein